MGPTSRYFLVITIALMAASSVAGQPICSPDGPVEELRYSWKLHGPLSWIAGIAFPTSGTGLLRTLEPAANLLDSELRISGHNRTDGYFIYRSQMEETGARTLMSYDGYAWRDRRRSERTFFDYVRRLARIRLEKVEKVRKIEEKERAIPHSTVRDVLTGIYFLRQNSTRITMPVRSEIYSGGKVYPVLFQPLGPGQITFRGRKVMTRRFEITAAPGTEKKWPGGIRVWLSEDENHTPLRIEIKRELAALQLDLDYAELCRPAN